MLLLGFFLKEVVLVMIKNKTTKCTPSPIETGVASFIPACGSLKHFVLPSISMQIPDRSLALANQ